MVLVLVLVEPAPDAPAAPLGRAEALPVAPTALADGLVAAPALADGLVVVVVVDVEVVPVPALRMSMKATVSPLLAMFRKVPATTGRLVVEPLGRELVVAAAEDVPAVLEDVPAVLEVPLAPLLLADVNDPLH